MQQRRGRLPQSLSFTQCPVFAGAGPERNSLIDSYAADHPSKFFAICSEALFVRPTAFEAEFPELYRLLAHHYRQDPAGTGALAGPPAV